MITFNQERIDKFRAQQELRQMTSPKGRSESKDGDTNFGRGRRQESIQPARKYKNESSSSSSEHDSDDENSYQKKVKIWEKNNN